jgi:serine phosphatase RsbU (regulator of sigma subunit)/putative methionine-R-sulfoxide reductase with GAF domain
VSLPSELRYRLLLELSQRISRTFDLQVVLDDLLHVLRSAVPYDAAGVFVLNQAVPLIRRTDPNVIAGMAQVGFDDPPVDDPMLRSGKGIIGHVIHTGETVIVPDVTREARYVAGRDATRSELAVPIVSESGTIGCLNVESDRPAFFTVADAELVEFFASAAALSIGKALLHRQVLDKQRLEDQLRVAQEVQSGLLPGAPPCLPGYDIAAVNIPSHAIGGDYYDYLPLGEGRLGLVVADVSGKGIPAALIMASFRALLRTQMKRRSRLTAVAAQLNDAVLEFRDASRYVTAVCSVLEAEGARVRYVNCGHNPPIVLRAGGGRETLRLGGAALGLFAGERFREASVRLEPGDCLVLYTDGVVEPTDDEDVEFGVDRLEDAVRSVADRTAPEALRAVVAATRAHSGRDRYDDDFTLVVVKRSALPR